MAEWVGEPNKLEMISTDVPPFVAGDGVWVPLAPVFNWFKMGTIRHDRAAGTVTIRGSWPMVEDPMRFERRGDTLITHLPLSVTRERTIVLRPGRDSFGRGLSVIKVDGKVSKLQVLTQMKGGRMFVPRHFLRDLGVEVVWDAEAAILRMKYGERFGAMAVPTKRADVPAANTSKGPQEIPKAGDTKINFKDGASMVWVPAGEFLMGSRPEDTDGMAVEVAPGFRATGLTTPDEYPQHKVYLNGFWIYKMEVTVRQYRTFCSATGRRMPEPPSFGWTDSHPITNVSWDDACAYSKWAEVSLPTEAQWEKAARGTELRIYPWGNEWEAARCTPYGKGTKPVGSHPTGASPCGCLDMAGNAMEWCQDWYGAEYYQRTPPTFDEHMAGFVRNPMGPDNGTERVLRGGSYGSVPLALRAASRAACKPQEHDNSMGFRCTKTQ